MTITSATESGLLKQREWSFEDIQSAVADPDRSIYAIVDSTERPEVWAKVDELGGQGALSLYSRGAARKFRHVAPYLLRVDEALFSWLLNTLWGSDWGIFVESATAMRPLRLHLHDLLTVQDLEGKRIGLRFYDPLVLPSFLDVCNARELREFFRVPLEFVVADNEAERMVGFGPGPVLTEPDESAEES